MVRSMVGLLALLLATEARAAEMVVEPRTVVDRKAVFATVESVDVTAARARIGGTVGELAVDEGSAVTAGQKIAVVADPKLLLELSGLDQRIRAQEAQRGQAAVEFERAEALFRNGTVPKSRLDDASTRLAVADRALDAIRADRKVLAERMAEGAVLAPAAGRVLTMHAIDGSVVLPGERVATIAAENYVLRLKLPERHARTMKVGDAVLVGERQGRIVQVYPTIEQGRVTADAAVDGLGDFFVGERVRVHVGTGERATFVLPAGYVYRRFGVEFVRLKDGTEVVVQTGQDLPGGIEVLAGLRAGDVVVSAETAR